jgi:type I restriction enzyme S subunit
MSLTRYTTYRETGLEWLETIPTHWEVKRLKQFCSVFPSNVDKKSVEGETPVKLCNYTDVYYNDFIAEDLEFMEATATEEQIKKFTLQAGDTIITKDSEAADDIAIAACVTKDLPGVICGYHLSVVRPKEVTYGAFVKRLFDSIYAKSLFAVRANGLTRVGLSQYAIDNVELPLPPIKEQKAIATFLDRETAKIDALMAEQQRLIELLQEKRQAVISHAVTKGLNPNAPMKDSGVEWLGEVPEHWEVKASRHIALIGRGASPRPAGDPRFFGGDFIPWVTVAEITKDENIWLKSTEEHLTKEGAINSSEFAAGTVLYSNSGATLGVPKISRMNCCANDGVVGFRNLSPDITPEFLYYYLYQLTGEIREWAKQGQGQPNLNTDIIKSIQLAIPPLDEQRQIVDSLHRRLKQSDSLLNDVVSAQALLAERRSALISAAVTGQIDVRGLVTEAVGQ